MLVCFWYSTFYFLIHLTWNDLVMNYSCSLNTWVSFKFTTTKPNECTELRVMNLLLPLPTQDPGPLPLQWQTTRTLLLHQAWQKPHCAPNMPLKPRQNPTKAIHVLAGFFHRSRFIFQCKRFPKSSSIITGSTGYRVKYSKCRQISCKWTVGVFTTGVKQLGVTVSEV